MTVELATEKELTVDEKGFEEAFKKHQELSRQHQAMREAALRSAEEDGLDVEMSVEDRARLEMQENAINMARDHPEDVAQLIRTWLVEE